MYHPNQNVYPYHHDYPYEPRTHTYASPAGMYYPASNTHPIPLGPDTLADLRQREGTSYPKYGQGRGGGLSTGRGYDTHNRYGPGDWVPADPRVGLGISTTGHAELIHSQIAPHTSYDFRRPDQHFELPPIPNRSITLDSNATTGRRPYANPSYSRSPAHFEPPGGTRTASPLSTRSSQKVYDRTFDRNDNPWPKGRVDGPPKAPLGGIGGKPWDERIKDDRSVSSPLPQASGSTTPLRPVNGLAEEVLPTFKGSPIIFKPPPSTYSPDDSPETPTTHLESEGGSGSAEKKPCRVPRKEAYPWPVHSPRGPPDTIPLPPSPLDSDPERSRRRTWTSIASTDIMEPSNKLTFKGKEVIVSLPNEGVLEEQRALERTKVRQQEIWDAVHVRPTTSVNLTEDDSVGEHQGITMEESDLEKKKSKLNSTPPREPSTEDLNRTRSPPTPTRRGQPSTTQGNSAFVRRQLGGMLRSGPTGRIARATPSASSIPEVPTSGGGDQASVGGTEMDRKDTALGDVTGNNQSGLGLTDGPTKNTLPEVTAGLSSQDVESFKDQGDVAEEVEDKAFTSPASMEHPVELTSETTEDTPSAQSIQDIVPDEQIIDRVAQKPPVEHTTRKQSDAETTTPSAQRLRPTAKSYEPLSRHSSTSSITPDTRPKAKLRPTANAFTPRALSSTASSIHVPAGAGDFTFSIEGIKHRGMQSWSSLESDDQPIFGAGFMNPPLNQSGVPGTTPEDPQEVSAHTGPPASDEPRGTQSEGGHADIPDSPRRQSITGPNPESASPSTASEPSYASRSFDKDDEMDIPTARPFSTTGTEERFSTHQRPTPAQGSPATEIHAIFASPDRHSSPLSEISDSMEVLSDTFDPVSYSYETDTESTYEVSSTAVFFTSTPRGGHQVLPLDSIQSDSESGRSSPEEYHTVPTVSVDQDPRRRFMEWTFPSPGHGRLPSIYRRHTFDHLNSHEDEDVSLPEHGVASTFASRVGDLRAHLAKDQGGKDNHLRVTSGPGGMLSNRSSAKFPMRSPSRVLTVVNDDAGKGSSKPEDHLKSLDAWDEVAIRHAELTGKLADVLEALQSRQPAPKTDLSPLTQMLEQQSTLISSLANVTQQNRGHQNDHLIPLLEGQQTVLDKLSTVEEAHSEVTDLLARFDEQLSEVVGDLRSELAEIKAEKAELAERLHRLEVELLETRQEIAQNEEETSKIRDKFDMAHSRNAALELHLQTLIKDKDSVAREYEQDQKTREREQLLHKKTLVDLHAKSEELIGEKRRNEVLAETIRSQPSELVELRRSTSKFHETLVDRLSRIEEGVQGSTVNSAEYVKLQDRNERLLEEINRLKEKQLHSEAERHNDHTKAATTLRELEALRKELDIERDLRQKAVERAETSDEALQKESVLRFQAQMMAKERSHFANMQEVQLGARTRECNYWQTFALTYDRNAYRNYLKSKPFHGITDSAGTSTTNSKGTPNSIPTYEELHTPKSGSSGGDDQQTPTKARKLKGKEVATMDEDREAWSSRAE